MIPEDKNSLINLLNLATDYVKGGYKQEREEIPGSAGETIKTDEAVEADEEKKFSLLPLAYQVEEEEDTTLEDLGAAIVNCQACPLAKTRIKAVPGEGAEDPLVMVIGEGPGADEDAAGRPFVGKAGQLLDKMLASIGLFRDKNCFIANMVKCRPPGNRDPHPEEITSCYPFLEQQIYYLMPKVILCAGRVAAQNLLKTSTGINALRGSFAELNIGGIKIKVLPSFHPSALLWDASLKHPAWKDLKMLRDYLASINEEYALSLVKTNG